MSVVELTIDNIAAGGDGIGRVDTELGSVVVFVPRTAPGDRVRARIETKKRFARGVVEEIIVASPHRVDPLCYHYRVDRCGGCQVQHLSYEAQLAAKRGVVRDAVTRIGKRAIDLPAIVASDKQWQYRRKLTLAFRKNGDDSWTIGLHPYDDPVGVFELADCPITDARVLTVWKQIMEASSFYPLSNELRASVQLVDHGASVVMEGANEWPARAKFFEAVPGAVALFWRPANRTRSLVAERGIAGSSGTASFAQINEGVARELHEYVLDRARAHRPGTAIDAYAGSGSTAIPLATDGVRVTAIEVDREATALCAARLPAGSRAIAARVEDALANALPADLVLVNPPRTGLLERVSSALQSVTPPPRAIVYVSCDPATLARDLTRLPRYRVESLRSFDMFPQTAHVETVCELVPETA
jgi:23S rRNA (uracil1939-C5)-methyltransferase